MLVCAVPSSSHACGGTCRAAPRAFYRLRESHLSLRSRALDTNRCQLKRQRRHRPSLQWNCPQRYQQMLHSHAGLAPACYSFFMPACLVPHVGFALTCFRTRDRLHRTTIRLRTSVHSQLVRLEPACMLDPIASYCHSVLCLRALCHLLGSCSLACRACSCLHRPPAQRVIASVLSQRPKVWTQERFYDGGMILITGLVPRVCTDLQFDH